MLDKIILDLERLRDELKSSGNPTVEYIEFLLVSVSISMSQETCLKEIYKTLRIIESGSKIVEYADFNDAQQIIWLEIWRDAENLLRKYSCK